MYRIRFHGRGGQGIKTASRILGSAAFREGFAVLGEMGLSFDAYQYHHQTPMLTELARASGFNSHYISQAINQNLGINFLEFINRYRVDHARERLTAEGASILQVAMDAGFNSKSSFYSAFRKIVGQTPSQYRQRQIASGKA